MAARAVAASTTTGSDGSYGFNSVMPGTYTIYASSKDSSEGAVTTNITVTAGARVVAADLLLTPVGSLSGRIQLEDNETGNLGFLVFVAGTSYMAITNDAGDFSIGGIPAGSDYEVVVLLHLRVVVATVAAMAAQAESLPSPAAPLLRPRAAAAAATAARA
jgi:hypothetical protein